ncbi:MAG: hypothetical protein KF767_08890 [Bdellovibrionaceae bacterium]|nr:hypothetical protein [Pseudobdellovibrionaceae bacterium]
MSRDVIPSPQDLQPELDLTDASNRHSLVNMLPGKMAEALQSIPLEVLSYTETELKRVGNIGLTEERLREAFWLEYNFASLGGRIMNLPNIYNGVCRKEYWWKIIQKDAYKMAFICLPPPAYRVQLKHMLTVALDQQLDILTRDHVLRDKQGNDIGTDARLAAVKVKISEILMNRVYGSVTQKVVTQNQNVNVEGTPDGEKESLEDIDRRIRELEEKGGAKLLEARLPEVRDADLDGAEE